MPTTVLERAIGPVLEGVGIVGGGALQARAQNRATDAHTASTDKALAYQQGQDEKAEARYAQAWEQWEAGRRELMERYGIDIAPPQMPGGPGGPGGAPPGPPGAQPRAMAPQLPPQMADAKGIDPGQGRSLGELGNWNWEGQGLGRRA